MAQPRYIPATYGKLSRLNDTNAEIGAGLAVMSDGGEKIKLPTSAAACVIGITLCAIPVGSYGDICVLGGSIVPYVNNGGVTEGQLLQVATSGKMETFATSAGDTDACVGLALETAADEAVSEMLFFGPGNFVQVED